MKKEIIVGLFCLVVWGLSLQSCGDDDPIEPQEFVADDSTFDNYTSWTLEVTNTGTDPGSLIAGGAHAGDSDISVRDIYFKDDQDPVDGVYPVGTVVAKHTTTTDGTVDVTHAMVKRGNDFNPTSGNWEYFTFTAAGAIDGRGMLEGCMNCHGAASASDFIFSK